MKVPARRTGFTLVEVLVSLALGLMLVVAVQALVANGYTTARRIERQQEQVARRRLPRELLERDLAALPPGAALTLKPGVLEFVSLNAMQSERGAARHTVEVRYTVGAKGDAAGGAVELRRVERELGSKTEWTPGVLLSGELSTIGFEVWDGRQWQPRVPTGGASVRALRVTLTPRYSSPEMWNFALAPLEWKHHAK